MKMKQFLPAMLLFVPLALSACNAKTDDGGKIAGHNADSSVAVAAEEVKPEATTPPPTGKDAILANVVKQGEAIVANRKVKCSPTGKRSASASDPTGFVLVTDIVPDVIMEARYYSSYNFVGTKVDGYEEPVVLCTREAAVALKKVSDNLKSKGYLIKIFDGYRPQKAVDHFCRWAKTADVKMKKDFYPGKAKTSLFPTYIARKSGHSKGSTFDLTIVDMSTGKDVDMGGPFDYFGELSHYAYSGITKQQAANRKILRDAMVAAGFKPYSNEWWHFTLTGEPYPSMYFTFPVNSTLVK